MTLNLQNFIITYLFLNIDVAKGTAPWLRLCGLLIKLFSLVSLN